MDDSSLFLTVGGLHDEWQINAIGDDSMLNYWEDTAWIGNNSAGNISFLATLLCFGLKKLWNSMDEMDGMIFSTAVTKNSEV